MTTTIMYSTTCTLTLYYKEGDLKSSDWRQQYRLLQEALDEAKFILEALYPEDVERIIIYDANTGEVLAECLPDDIEEDDDPDYRDWDYNEDMGFDPYMGCYSDDC